MHLLSNCKIHCGIGLIVLPVEVTRAPSGLKQFSNKVHHYPDLSIYEQPTYQKDWSMTASLPKGWKLATVHPLITIIIQMIKESIVFKYLCVKWMIL